MSDIMMDGSPLCEGDEVYCLHNGHGEVTGIDKGEYPIVIIFDNDTRASYTRDFKLHTTDLTRNLYWQKPEIIPPPKPKKKIKVWDWFVEMEDGSIIRINASSDYRQNVMWYVKTAQKIHGTEREIEIS